MWRSKEGFRAISLHVSGLQRLVLERFAVPGGYLKLNTTEAALLCSRDTLQLGKVFFQASFIGSACILS